MAFFSEYRFKAQEHFLVGYLNSRNALIAAQVLNVGLTTESIVDVNNCIAMALLVGASKVVFVHNHPSGEALPSQADKNITEEMRRKFRMFSIAVVDHVILGNGTYFSFCEEGLLA
ncbi:JAB domain-containing protein [candidate division KSB1 bacterium]|nr:JAB domain-containing protein [candidate division KSB1 bacterium]